MQDTASRNVDCVIDHGVLLISTEDFERPPPWLSDNFNILEGGNHQGQLYFALKLHQLTLR